MWSILTIIGICIGKEGGLRILCSFDVRLYRSRILNMHVIARDVRVLFWRNHFRWPNKRYSPSLCTFLLESAGERHSSRHGAGPKKCFPISETARFDIKHRFKIVTTFVSFRHFLFLHPHSIICLLHIVAVCLPIPSTDFCIFFSFWFYRFVYFFRRFWASLVYTLL